MNLDERQKAQSLQRLLANEDFLALKEILQKLKDDLESQVWNNPSDEELRLIIAQRNIINIIMTEPYKVLDIMREKARIEISSDSSI